MLFAEPDEVKEDGSGGLEGGDVGEGILWKDQHSRALPEQQVFHFVLIFDKLSMNSRFAGENRYQNTIGAAFGAREVSI